MKAIKKICRFKVVWAEQEKTGSWLSEQIDKSKCTYLSILIRRFNAI